MRRGTRGAGAYRRRDGAVAGEMAVLSRFRGSKRDKIVHPDTKWAARRTFGDRSAGGPRGAGRVHRDAGASVPGLVRPQGEQLQEPLSADARRLGGRRRDRARSGERQLHRAHRGRDRGQPARGDHRVARERPALPRAVEELPLDRAAAGARGRLLPDPGRALQGAACGGGLPALHRARRGRDRVGELGDTEHDDGGQRGHRRLRCAPRRSGRRRCREQPPPGARRRRGLREGRGRMSATTTPIGHPPPAAVPPPSHEAQVWDRVETQIQWYGRNARRSKRNYMRIKLVQIVAAAFIPVLAAASLPSWVLGGLGASVVVLESVQQLFQFHSNWTQYRTTAEALKHEKFLALAQAGSLRDGRQPARAAGRAHRGPRISGARRVVLRAAATAAERTERLTVAQRIFISYRRDDSRGYAGRLQGDLSRRYSDEHVFRDIEIPPGADFGEYITSLVDKCNVVLAIIGPGWLDARDREGERRLDDPQDWVRLEIERALARDGVEVIPVLVDGARLPPREELPRVAARAAPAQRVRALRPPLGLRRRGSSASTSTGCCGARARCTSAPPPGVGDPAPHAAAAATPAPRRPAPEPADHTTTAVLAAAAVALLTAFPADLIARNLVDRAPLDRDDLVTDPRLRPREGDLLRHRRSARGPCGGLPLAPLARADRLVPARPRRGRRGRRRLRRRLRAA